MALLKTYTTIKASRTVAEIQAMLAKAGASGVGLEYSEGQPAALRFVIDAGMGRQSYSLPVNSGAVAMVLKQQGEKPRGTMTAVDIAWRIVKAWVEAQLAILETEMVTLDQIFLPYMLTDSQGTTVYQALKERSLELGAGS